MTDQEKQLQKLRFESFKSLLAEVLGEGYGEVSYRIVIKNGKIEYISLTKSSTFKVSSDTITL